MPLELCSEMGPQCCTSVRQCVIDLLELRLAISGISEAHMALHGVRVCLEQIVRFLNALAEGGEDRDRLSKLFKCIDGSVAAIEEQRRGTSQLYQRLRLGSSDEIGRAPQARSLVGEFICLQDASGLQSGHLPQGPVCHLLSEISIFCLPDLLLIYPDV